MGSEKKEAKREQWQEYTATTKANNFATHLTNTFDEQYKDAQEQREYLKNSLRGTLEQAATGKGMTPAEEAARRTEAEDTLSTKFAGEQQALREQVKSLGGTETTSGVTAAGETALDIAEAAEKSKAELGITEKSADIARQEKWAALQGLGNLAGGTSQLAAQLGGEANQAFGETASLGSATTGTIKEQAANKSLGGTIFSGVTGAAETAAGAMTGNQSLMEQGANQLRGAITGG